MSKLQDYIKKCRKAGLEDGAIKKYLLSYNVSENLVNEAFKKLEFKKNLSVGAVFAAIILILSALSFSPQFIGFVTQNQNTIYTDNVQLNITETSQITWTPTQSGELTSLLSSGRIIGNGTAKIYIKINNTRYLIIDTTTLKQKQAPLITGLVIGNETEEQTTPTDETTETAPEEDETPVQTEETPQTEETIEENITTKTTIEEETNNETINEEKQTTENNQTIENDETTTENNETIIEENNSTQTINEEVNETISSENNETISDNNSTDIINETIEENNNETLTDEEINPQINETIIIPDINETTAPENLIIEFENICQETCTLSGTQSDSYTIEFEIEGNANLIIDNLKYTIKEITIDENLTNINETELNITINETLTNLTLNITTNETTTNLTINETELNATINSSVEIEKPVKWNIRINKNKTSEITLPKEAFNITTTEQEIKIIINNTELNITQYNLQKQKDILKKDLKKLEKKKTKETNKQQKTKKGKTNTTKTDKEITDTQIQITQLEQITTNLTINQNITLVFTNENQQNNETTLSNETNETTNTNETNTENFINIEYYTEGPNSNETETNDYQKTITISSDIHYQNIKAYTDIIETQKELINLYWLKDTGKQQITDINYVDTNNNSLIDRIEWIVPHLSNETYEVTISILTLQSYPQVGGTWTVQFQTTGKANLTIETTNGTTFGTDIEHMNLKCGENTLTPTYDGVKVFIQDFECNTTATHEVHVLTKGKHTQKFTFGNTSAYAYNYAGQLPQTITLHGKLTNSTGGNINVSTAFNFSLYTTTSGGTAAWNETQTITVSEGVYTAILGSVNPISPSVINFSQPYYLGIQVNGDPEMTPRINLTSTPYSYNTVYAQEALDLICTDCIGNTEINTTGTFQIDGNLNATNNITLGNSIIGTDSKPRIQISSTGTIIINLQD